MVRVVRPGGRISLIDTDWSTFTIDVGDDAIAALVRDAMRTERDRPSNVGRRLHDLVAAAGCVPLARTEATQTWTTWDPDESPAPLGCFSMESLADDLVARDRLPATDRPTFVADDPRRRAPRPVLDAPHDVRGRRDRAVAPFGRSASSRTEATHTRGDSHATLSVEKSDWRSRL